MIYRRAADICLGITDICGGTGDGLDSILTTFPAPDVCLRLHLLQSVRDSQKGPPSPIEVNSRSISSTATIRPDQIADILTILLSGIHTAAR